MQEGIGRGGYRVLALVAAGLGALGLLIAAVGLDPSGFFEWLGLGLAFLCLLGLLGLNVATLGLPPAAPRPEQPRGTAGVVELATPEPPADPDPSHDVGFEYEDVTPVEAMAAEPPAPSPAPSPTGPPRIQPPPVPVTQPRRVHDAKGWPDVKPAGVTRRQLHERNLPRDPGPDIEVEGPAPAATRQPPVVMARTVASAEASGIPEGSSVGKCGNCGVLLLAPKKRPLRLQCPRCERVHTLG